MLKSAISRYIGHILWLEGVFMLPAAVVAAVYGEKSCIAVFLITGAALIAAGVIPGFLLKSNHKPVYARDGFIIVALGWVLMSLFGAVPFFASRAIPNFLDCWFETVSGFTTTGASILTEIETLPKSILYWRSFTHWLGGMGVLVFMLAVVPMSKGSGESLHVLRAESPGPSVGKLKPTLKETARTLYAIYISMTALECIMLVLGGMPFFDSLTNSFATAGTGGFAIKNASIAAYDSVYLQTVIGIFMVLFGVNFSIYYMLLLRQFRPAVKNTELRVYLLIILSATTVITLNILPLYTSFGKALLDSFFQVSSIMTTTGFATANFNLWPEFSRFLLLILMILGACAGSTGGGIKISRLIIMAKSLIREIRTLLHPSSVKVIQMDGKKVDNSVVHNTYAFMICYMSICCLSMLLISLDNLDGETTISSVLACINNIGPGLSTVGPINNYSHFSPLAKTILSLDMLFGRLEIFPMLIMLNPAAWKRLSR